MAVAAAAVGALYSLAITGAMFLACNVLVVASLALVAPWAPALHRRLLLLVTRLAWRSIYLWCRWWGGLSVAFYGDVAALQADPSASRLVICNHVSSTDTIVLEVLADSCRALEHVRAFIKRGLTYQPILGWFFRLLGFLAMARSFGRDVATIERQLHGLAAQAKEGPLGRYWLVIFPEGTRRTPAKVAESQAYAAAHGLPTLRRVLLPRVKGLQATLPLLRGTASAVADVTIGYERETADGTVLPTTRSLFFSRGCPLTVHIHVTLIPIAEVPTDPTDIQTWTVARFEAKEALLEHFHATGAFPGDRVLAPPVGFAEWAANFAAFLGIAALVLAAAALLLRRCFPS
jgi:1-acyl-sn-glycerol-3-phosphate acyltransferase